VCVCDAAWTPGLSGRMRKLSPISGSDPQPVSSRYINYFIPAHFKVVSAGKQLPAWRRTVVLLASHTAGTAVLQYLVGYTSAKVFGIVQRSTFTVSPYLANDIKHITKTWNRSGTYIAITM